MKMSFNSGRGSWRNRAFSLLDLLIVVGTIAMAVIVIPKVFFGRSRVYGGGLRCTTNLKQVALGFKMFSGDNNDHFPSQLTNSAVFTNRSEAWSHFQILSNELASPKILLCPADKARIANAAFDFGTNSQPGYQGLGAVGNLGVSYFVGLDASETNAASLLSGDRNILVSGRVPKDSVLQVVGNEPLRWTAELHANRGNIAFGDGSVQNRAQPYPVKGNPEVPVQRLLLPLAPVQKSNGR